MFIALQIYSKSWSLQCPSLSDFPKHPRLVRIASGAPAALLAADREWRESLDHARRDRAAVYEPHLVDLNNKTRRRRNSSRSIPNGKIPALLDSGWAYWAHAAAVRVE